MSSFAIPQLRPPAGPPGLVWVDQRVLPVWADRAQRRPFFWPVTMMSWPPGVLPWQPGTKLGAIPKSS